MTSIFCYMTSIFHDLKLFYDFINVFSFVNCFNFNKTPTDRLTDTHAMLLEMLSHLKIQHLSDYFCLFKVIWWGHSAAASQRLCRWWCTCWPPPLPPYLHPHNSFPFYSECYSPLPPDQTRPHYTTGFVTLVHQRHLWSEFLLAIRIVTSALDLILRGFEWKLSTWVNMINSYSFISNLYNI